MKWSFLIAIGFTAIMGVSTAHANPTMRQPAAAAKNTTISDVVKKVRNDEEGIVVLFTKNSGSYYLKNEVAGFDGFEKKLKESLNEKKTVNVTADSLLNILEVK